jgi:hypothetical protein
LVAAPIAVAAQETKKDEAPPARGQLPQHFKRLGLSDSQVSQVRKVRGEYRAKIDGLREQIKQLQADERKKLADVLSPDQRKRLAELRAGEEGKEKAKAKDGK